MTTMASVAAMAFVAPMAFVAAVIVSHRLIRVMAVRLLVLAFVVIIGRHHVRPSTSGLARRGSIARTLPLPYPGRVPGGSD